MTKPNPPQNHQKSTSAKPHCQLGEPDWAHGAFLGGGKILDATTFAAGDGAAGDAAALPPASIHRGMLGIGRSVWGKGENLKERKHGKVAFFQGLYFLSVARYLQESSCLLCELSSLMVP